MCPNDLKPCPFCNSDKIRDGYIRDGRRVYCADCSASVTAFQPNASACAANLWNSRFETDAQALIASLTEALEWTRKNYAAGSTAEINRVIDAALSIVKSETPQ